MSEELSFEQMLDESFKTIRNGEIVEGTVLDVKPDVAYLNIGYKSDGILTSAEYSNEKDVDLTTKMQVGDKMEVKVQKVNDGDGQVILSYKRLAAEKGNKRIEEAFNNKEVLKAKVSQVLNGGLTVLVEDTRVFIPASLVSDVYEKDLSKYADQEIEFRITEFNPRRRRIIGDRRHLIVEHKQFGEATAVMAGDALCVLAFELMGKTGNARAIEVLAHLLSTYGLIGGEMIDIECEGKEVDLETVDYIHYHKTAALIEAALQVGAMLAGASDADIQVIRRYGKSIGLAFQIVDDILDIVSTTEELGKDAGSDIEKGKATYPSVVGLDRSREKAKELFEESIKSLDSLSCDTEILRAIAAFIITRVK